MRSHRQHWTLRHRITGEIKKTSGYDREDGMWELVLAGGRDETADYEEEGSPLVQKLKKPRKAKEAPKEPASKKS